MRRAALISAVVLGAFFFVDCSTGKLTCVRSVDWIHSPVAEQNRKQIEIAGLSDHSAYSIAPEWRAIKVKNERQLRTALNNPELGWSDRRVIQLTSDLLLSATITISNPIRIEGYCELSPSNRCTVRAARPIPLFHITGPAALVQFGNLQLINGQSSHADMGGAITASNTSQLELHSCLLNTNSAVQDGGAILIATSSHLSLIDTEVSGNVAGGRGGGIFLKDGTLHMDKSVVTGNSADDGGGIFVAAGSLLTAIDSQVEYNLLRRSMDDALGETATDEALGTGADLVLEKASEGKANTAEAFFRPLPDVSIFSARGYIHDLVDLRKRLPGESAPEREFGAPRKLPASVIAAVRKVAAAGRKAGGKLKE